MIMLFRCFYNIIVIQILKMSQKQSKPEISIDLIKDVVKRFKTKGFESLTNHDLAVSITTVGFKQVCKQFGGQWNEKFEKQAYTKLTSSEYDLRWYGKVNNQNYLPFLQLCIRGDIEKAKEFIVNLGKAGKNDLISLTDNLKRSALHLAVREGFDVLAQYLIKQGFPILARDRQLKTPLHYCKNQLVSQLLLKKGANVIAKDNKNCTPAHYAASGTDFKVLQMMLKKTNVVNELDSTNKTPIFYAIYNDSQEQVNILRILVQNGAKINDKDILGKTPLHYAAQMGKLRCIPFLLQKGGSIDAVDSHNKTPLDLAANEKVKKIILAYAENKGIVIQKEEKQKRIQFNNIANASKVKDNQSKVNQKDQESSSKISGQIYTKQVNQVSTWVREKFFVLMKKLQQSGIKALWHLKRPYIYTGSWAEGIQSLEDLYESFLHVNGPEAAMRAFNILCPYQKPLPNILGKSQQAFQSFFGQNWFSNDPVEKVRNMHSQSKIRNQFEAKIKQNEDLKSQLLGYRSQIQKLEGNIMNLKSQLSHYQKIEQDLRRQRTKNTQQYTQMMKYMSQIANLKDQINLLSNGTQKADILSKMIEDLRSKNEDLSKEIQNVKTIEAAARRKCGQIFLKSLSIARAGQSIATQSLQGNLYDDDAIINLYELLKNNPPNLQKRFKQADRRGVGKVNIQQFTKLLENLSMLPQDVMSMHRITGFSFGRKTLSLQQFKTLLENRHKNRPMWQKQLIRKIKSIILSQGISIGQLFKMIDEDGSGTIESSQLRNGLEGFNIFMNQSDWSNLFNLLDSDKSGTIQLQEMKNLFELETTGKLDQVSSQIKSEEQSKPQPPKKKEQEQKQEQQQKQQQEQQQKQQQGQKQEQQQAQNQEQKQAQNKQEEDNNNQQQNLQNEEQEDEKNQNEQKQYQQNNEEVNNNQQEKSQNKLLSQQQQEKSEYQQQDQEAEAGIQKLNGQIKVQIPKIELPEDAPTKVFIKLVINEQQTVKMANLQLPKLAIVVKFQMIEYKILSTSDLKLCLTISKSRQFDQQGYLGEATIQLENIFAEPQKWGVNQSFELQASEYQKDVSGSIVIQTKWTPKQQ